MNRRELTCRGCKYADITIQTYPTCANNYSNVFRNAVIWCKKYRYIVRYQYEECKTYTKISPLQLTTFLEAKQSDVTERTESPDLPDTNRSVHSNSREASRVTSGGSTDNSSVQRDETMKYKLCGYSNCFRPFYKMRGFMPCCEFHFKNPLKWGKDGLTYTGSVWRKKDNSMTKAEKPFDFLHEPTMCQGHKIVLRKETVANEEMKK